MSHFATNWAMSQRGLKPAARILLWHMADAHSPDTGCLLSIANLARRAELSETTCRYHLAQLIARGLVRTLKRRATAAGQRSVRGFAFAFEASAEEVGQ
ncbi:helix-turn-helix domain-containing protein [Cereibacter sphaeroides]|uniref:helix-turn-helix domain-containing protein n=1 Tax=Cereibacter sphaeroides TaxID=1063 RepID=UPI001F17FEE8|nr:helix-turn-helix domain-containing protein [Cereibacter sphaeroides]MCE6952405.1 helix-turn-helix domain-containing protein [Cereibacter sphaeroides]